MPQQAGGAYKQPYQLYPEFRRDQILVAQLTVVAALDTSLPISMQFKPRTNLQFGILDHTIPCQVAVSCNDEPLPHFA